MEKGDKDRGEAIYCRQEKQHSQTSECHPHTGRLGDRGSEIANRFCNTPPSPSVRNLLGEPGGTSSLSHMSELQCALSSPLLSLLPPVPAADHDPCSATRKEPRSAVSFRKIMSISELLQDRLFNLTVAKHCIDLTSISPRHTHDQ
ncbi:unnamed protein product [Pleuronectes platessa]|uniref:Uncharacterized protein n=1 Tax=Pleuronectes platessa TaxID=8262 RepID=A0A9N7V2H8_PLEPL|nr:unnamed protein product [Pleuronectes platessa]